MTDFNFERARRSRGLPRHIVTQAQVQGEVHAYLLERGRHLAEDIGPGPFTDQDLITLAELDCVAANPTLSPGLACTLEMVADRQHPNYAKNQHELDHTTGRVHDHGRLRETGVDLDLDHDRVQLMGLDRELGHAPARDGVSIRPEPSESPAPTGVDQGQGGTAARAGRKTRRRKPNILDESLDPLHFLEDDD